jgi:murein DD-endopeptidase MepM/ murein hydrolase activator NlpD
MVFFLRSKSVGMALALGATVVTGWGQSTHRAPSPRSTAPSAVDSRTTATTGPIKNVFWQPNSLKQGSPAFFTVELEGPALRVSATLGDKTLTFFHADNARVWYALAGADLDLKPGSYDLVVTASLAGGHLAKKSLPVELAEANFKSGSIDVPENFVEPDAEGKRQIAKDEIVKARAYAHVTPKPLWSGNFVTPVNARPTDTFGESRILNEEKSSIHRGTDFPVNEGASVVASNSGTVVLASDLFYEGGCVIVDHGQRFFTIYMHLSKIEVVLGDKLEKGARVGLSGKTGRVTGPHLHMGVRWNGAYLDPVQLLALTLPKLDSEKMRPPFRKPKLQEKRRS